MEDVAEGALTVCATALTSSIQVMTGKRGTVNIQSKFFCGQKTCKEALRKWSEAECTLGYRIKQDGMSAKEDGKNEGCIAGSGYSAEDPNRNLPLLA